MKDPARAPRHASRERTHRRQQIAGRRNHAAGPLQLLEDGCGLGQWRQDGYRLTPIGDLQRFAARDAGEVDAQVLSQLADADLFAPEVGLEGAGIEAAVRSGEAARFLYGPGF